MAQTSPISRTSNPGAPAHLPPILDLDDDGLAALVDEAAGGPAFRVRQVKEWIYGRATADAEEMTNLPKPLRALLAERGVHGLETVDELHGDDGLTVKWLHRTREADVETVLMRYADRTTVCVSSQAGCAQRCPFCATGQGGFDRNLTVGEIVAQVLHAERRVRSLAADGRSPGRVGNVVFMGMGEPLANYDSVLAAIWRLNRDVGISARSMTVSTIGIPGRMRSLAREAPPVTLAVSLHAPDDALRDVLVPPNRRWPIADVLDAARAFAAEKGRRVTVEYTLMDTVNDRPEQAEALARLLRPLDVHVNCIPMNPTGDPSYRPSRPESVRAFVARLRARGVNATVRKNRGVDVDGACGQLRARHVTDGLGAPRTTGMVSRKEDA